MLDLVELRAKNIFRFKNLKIDFTIDDSFIFIRGRNGSGKSLVGDILTDVLFDKAIRKHPAKSFIGPHGKRGFSSLILVDPLTKEEFQIRKHRNHPKYSDRVFFYRIDENGKKINLSKKKKRDTYAVIWKVLGIKWETFKNRNFFGQRDSKRFLDVTDSKKAEIIIDIQDLEDLQACKKKSHEASKEKEKESTEVSDKIEKISISNQAVKESLNRLKKSTKETKKRKEEEKKRLEESVESIKKKIRYAEQQTKGAEDLRYELSVLKVQIEQADIILSQVDEVSEELNSIRMSISLKRKDSKKATSDIKSKKKDLIGIKGGDIKKCVYCGAVLNEIRTKRLSKKLSFEIAELKTKVKKLSDNIDSLKKKSARTRGKLRGLNERKNELSPMIKKRESLLKDLRLKEKWESEIEASKREMSEKEKFLSKLKKEIVNIISDSPLPDMIRKRNEAEKIIKGKKTELNEIKVEKGKHDYAEAVFESSMREIFGDFLKDLDKWTNSFAQDIFEESIKVKLNPKRETGSEKVIDELNVTVSVNDEDHKDARLLSGSERGRVDVAIQLGLFSSAESPFPLIWMDEPLEGMDKQNILLVLDLLKRKSEEGVKVIMITHQPIPTGMGASLKITKKKTYSTIS